MTAHMCETLRPETCYRCALTLDEIAAAHREQLAEYEALGRPPLCDCCGGYYDAYGEWDTLPTCAESPLSHHELCENKRYRNDVCPACRRRLDADHRGASVSGAGATSDGED